MWWLTLVVLWNVCLSAFAENFHSDETRTMRVEGVEPDRRCLRPAQLDDLERFNKICAIEQEVIRLTNLHRARYGKPPLQPNPELSYVVRYQATLPYRTHAYFYEGFHQKWYRQWFPRGPELALVGENAWPPAHQGTEPEQIAFNLADTRAPASDGHPAGWNHHPGHGANVLRDNADQIAVGVDIRPDGSVVAYTVFARAK